MLFYTYIFIKILIEGKPTRTIENREVLKVVGETRSTWVLKNLSLLTLRFKYRSGTAIIMICTMFVRSLDVIEKKTRYFYYIPI